MSFKSWRSYYGFSESVRTKQRYILDDESRDFLNSIIDTCEHRVRLIKSGISFWRAQIGHESKPVYVTPPDSDEQIHINDEPISFPFKRMKPLPDSASEGRANPKGIPCLYVASDKETAMSEVRPWLEAKISLGHLKIARDLKVLDFSVSLDDRKIRIYFEEPDIDKIIEAVWADIDDAFSRPIKSSDLQSDYAPTQIISEFIKSKGYDGIAYKSSLSDGYNIALFDLNSAEVVNCKLYEASKIKFDFESVAEF